MAAVAAVLAHHAWEPSGESQPTKRPHAAIAGFAEAQSRIISARVWHTRIPTVPNANSRRIGRSLSALRPTWVTGLLRYARNQYPHRGEVRAWNQIRRIVRASSPHAQFDVVLNALQYRTPRGDQADDATPARQARQRRLVLRLLLIRVSPQDRG